MSTSQHPVALRLERVVGGDAKLLAVVMMLPLIDGVFPALILTGALSDPLGAIQVGLLIFGGSATTAVILAEMGGTPREQVKAVLLVGMPLILFAAVQAALAPAIGSVLNTVIFERFAAVVILAIAAKTASSTIGDYLPNPGVIIGLGLIASVNPAEFSFALMDDPRLVANATLAAVSGVGFALAVALSGPYLREYMDIDRFRFGSAVALGLLPLSLVGMAFGQAPLAALIVAAVFAVDLSFEQEDAESRPIDELRSSRSASPRQQTATADTTPAVGTGPLADGGLETTPKSESTPADIWWVIDDSNDEESAADDDSSDAEDPGEHAPMV